MTISTYRRCAALVLLSLGSSACGSDGTGPDFATLMVTTNALADAPEGQPYSEGINAEGGDGQYEWSVSAGSLPNGLMLSVEDLTENDALLTGTPTREGSYAFTIRVQSGDGQSATADFTLDVLPPPRPLAINTVFLPPALAGAGYDVTLRATGGDGQSYAWSVVGGSLPPGLSLSGTDIQGTPTAAGAATVTLAVTSGGASRQKTFTIDVVADQAGFQITPVEVAPVPSSVRPALAQAIAKWEAAISGDLQAGLIGKTLFNESACGGYGRELNGGAVEDVVILVEIRSIDGPGQVLGQAGPCATRSSAGSSSGLPPVGLLTLDADDLRTYTPERMYIVLSHEIAHVLGFGSLWELQELVIGAGSGNPEYVGANAIQEWHALGGSDNVPVEGTGGAGTADTHWDEDTFGSERMTGFVSAVGDQPLSRLSIAAMADLGYTVDLTAADPYSLSLLRDATPSEMLGYDVVLRPTIAVRPDGTPVPLERR